MTETTDLFKKLSGRIPTDSIKFRKGSANKDKSKNRILAYVDARDVQTRLDDVVGPANWQDKYTRFDGGFICELSIRVDGEWITKSGVGEDRGDATEDNAIKSAESDALKRAAVKFGIARHLYTDIITPMWVPKTVPDWEVTATLRPVATQNEPVKPAPKAKVVDSESHQKMLLIDEIMLMSKAAFKTLDERDAKFDELKAGHEVERLSDLSMPVLERLKARLVDLRIELESEPEPNEPETPPEPRETINDSAFQNLKKRIVETYGPELAVRKTRSFKAQYHVQTLADLTAPECNQLLVQIGNDQVAKENGNGHKPEKLVYVATGTGLFIEFMNAGKALYGAEFGKKDSTDRKYIVGRFTDGRSESSKEMTVQEMLAARDWMTEAHRQASGVLEQG